MTSPSSEGDFQQQVLDRLDALKRSDDELRQEVSQFDNKFTTYQKATQWVVQLAFTLIASATLTVIITSVLKK